MHLHAVDVTIHGLRAVVFKLLLWHVSRDWSLLLPFVQGVRNAVSVLRIKHAAVYALGVFVVHCCLLLR